jgi:hypothetical protein
VVIRTVKVDFIYSMHCNVTVFEKSKSIIQSTAT